MKIQKKEGCCNTLIEFGADISLKYRRDKRRIRKFTINKFGQSVEEIDINDKMSENDGNNNKNNKN
jgi:hypothetical protein